MIEEVDLNFSACKECNGSGEQLRTRQDLVVFYDGNRVDSVWLGKTRLDNVVAIGTDEGLTEIVFNQVRVVQRPVSDPNNGMGSSEVCDSYIGPVENNFKDPDCYYCGWARRKHTESK